MILLTRKAEFSSSHYYWSDQLSAAENVRLFGKCANRNGHGHNYTLEVTVNLEVEEFKHVIPTTENLAIAIWKRLENRIEGAKLHRIRVYETPDLFSDYYGEA
jgi:6-pyruvoyltetrahydropterin/6-carboxytetrahydropterin synthase